MEIRIGLIGSGKIAALFCAAARADGRILPSAILSRTEETGRRFAEKNCIPAVFTEERAFLASGIQAVYIATPNATHARLARAALDVGLDVFVEKPAVLTEAEWLSLAETAKARRLVLFEGMRPLHDPFFSLVREYLPRVGRLRTVQLAYCQYSSRYDAFRAGEVRNAFDPSLGNAALLDIGVHPAAIAVALFGRAQSVVARSVFLANGFEGCGEALLAYGDFHLSITYSKITEGVTPSVFLGEDGALTVEGHLNAPHRLTFAARGQTPRVLAYAPVENNMIYEIAAFARLVEARQADHPFLAVTADELALLESIRAASGIHLP